MRLPAVAASAAFLSAALCATAMRAAAPPACHALLAPQDARLIAMRIPNARAFAENEHATLTTALVGRPSGGTLHVQVTATVPGGEPMDVGVYTVNLRTGAVVDDDQEPADDAVTQVEEARLLERRCGQAR